MMTRNYRWFRSLTSLIFIYAGMNHLVHPGGVFRRIASSTIYQMIQSEWLFQAAVIFTGALMVIGGVALFIGYKSGSAAGLLLTLLIIITLSTQLENLNDLGPFFKNIAIAGSLLFIINRKDHETKNNFTGSTNAVHQHAVIHAKSGRSEKG